MGSKNNSRLNLQICSDAAQPKKPSPGLFKMRDSYIHHGKTITQALDHLKDKPGRKTMHKKVQKRELKQKEGFNENEAR